MLVSMHNMGSPVQLRPPRSRGVRHGGSALLQGGLVLLVSAQTLFAAEIVISQIYGGGGNSGASYLNDFVELFNRGTNPVNVSGWSVQYASATGSNWQVTPIAGVIGPGSYHLVQQGSGGASGQPLPVPDTVGAISMSSSAGKVALVSNATPLGETCPSGPHILDFAGYGATASCFEGSGHAPAPGNSTAVFRANDGCADSEDNAADFFASNPAPRNSSSDAHPCSSVPAAALALHAIQGTGQVSALAGRQLLTTTNVVTALRSDGFFIQGRAGESDADPNTSEGLFVFTPAGLPAAAMVGNAVVVSGIVEERHANGDSNTLSRTQLINASTVVVASGSPLPPAVELAASDASPSGPPDQLERFESMRVRVSHMIAAGPTEGFVIESSATGVSDGVFFGVPVDTPRPFREAGIPILDPLPPGAPYLVPRFDANPERLRVDGNAQPGAVRIEVTTGAIVSNVVGVLDFDARHYTILPDSNAGITVSGNRGATPVPIGGSNELTVAAFNLERFFDAQDDPATDDAVLSGSAFEGRLRKASLVIRTVLRTPDVLGVEEMENLSTLEVLAARINADSVAVGSSGPGYAAWLFEGNDVGGINIGFLVNTSRVTVLEVSQIGKSATYLNPLSGLQETLNDRPPLLLRAEAAPPGGARPFVLTALLVHQRSLNGIADPVDGLRVRAKRRAQAEFVANFIQQRRTADPVERILCLGDFNAYSVNDGYVDVIGTILGRPAPSNEVTLASADLVEPDLHNLLEDLPLTERYSYVFEGNAQAIDHILVNQVLRPYVKRFAFARCGADFPESWRSNTNRAERLSDHDAPIVYLALGFPPRVTRIERTTPDHVEVEWIGEPAVETLVEASVDLEQWSQVGRRTNDTFGAGSYVDETAFGEERRFYRIRQP